MARRRGLPHCGVVGNAYKIAANPEKRVRFGLWKCRDCRKQFTVKVGTVFGHARLPLHKMLQAAYLLCSSKKGISAHQISRTLEVSLKAAWFLAHRIREAMAPHNASIMGGLDKSVEVDETYTGGKERNRHRSRRRGDVGAKGKEAVFALIEQNGRVHFMHVASVTTKNLREILIRQLHPGTKVMTDGAGQYRHISDDFPHQSANHDAGEYVRGEAHTNTIEGYFSIIKRGIIGVYQHISQQHLKRYLAEFDFRYNERAALEVDDFSRTVKALVGISGKRLSYRPGVTLR